MKKPNHFVSVQEPLLATSDLKKRARKEATESKLTQSLATPVNIKRPSSAVKKKRAKPADAGTGRFEIDEKLQSLKEIAVKKRRATAVPSRNQSA